MKIIVDGRGVYWTILFLKSIDFGNYVKPSRWLGAIYPSIGTFGEKGTLGSKISRKLNI